MKSSLSKIDVSKLEKIDAKAASILSSAQTAVYYIKKRREQMDKQGLKNQPLNIISGENHDKMAQILRHSVIMELLEETGEPIVCGLELSNSFIMNRLRNYKWDMDTDDQFFNKCFADQNHNYSLNLKFNFLYISHQNAPYSAKTLTHSLIENPNIPVKFTDAPFTVYTTYLDHKEPSLFYIAKECFDGDLPTKPISRYHHKGMQIRDRYAALSFTSFTKDTSPRYAFHISGNAHLTGCTQTWNTVTKDGKKQELIYPLLHHHKNSLSKQIKDMGGHVIALPTISTNFRISSIPNNQTLKQHNEIVICDKLPQDSVNYDVPPSIEDIFASPEKDWVNKRLENLGLHHMIIDNPDELFMHYEDDVEQAFNKIKRSINASKQNTQEIEPV